MAHSEATVIKKQPHTYTKDERLEIGSRIAETLDQLDQLEIERKAAADKFKGLIGDGEGKLKKLRLNHSQGFEMREHECYVVRNTSTQMVEFVDVESGEIIDSRPFTTDDWAEVHKASQLALDLEDSDAPDENEIRAKATPDLFTADDAPAGEPTTEDVSAAKAEMNQASDDLDAAMEANAADPNIGGANHDDPAPASDDTPDDDEPAADEDDSIEPEAPAPKVPKRPANKKK